MRGFKSALTIISKIVPLSCVPTLHRENCCRMLLFCFNPATWDKTKETMAGNVPETHHLGLMSHLSIPLRELTKRDAYSHLALLQFLYCLQYSFLECHAILNEK